MEDGNKKRAVNYNEGGSLQSGPVYGGIREDNQIKVKKKGWKIISTEVSLWSNGLQEGSSRYNGRSFATSVGFWSNGLQ